MLQYKGDASVFKKVDIERPGVHMIFLWSLLGSITVGQMIGYLLLRWLVHKVYTARSKIKIMYCTLRHILNQVAAFISSCDSIYNGLLRFICVKLQNN